MKNLIFLSTLILLTGCKMLDAVDAVNETPQKMDNMNAEMQDMKGQMLKTNEAIRMQKLAIAKENLEDEKNGMILTPIPFGLMGYAKLFAETAKVDELVAQTYLYITDVHDGLPAPLVGEDGSALDFTAEQISRINQYKSHRFAAMQAIANFIPTAVLAQMIDEEIIAGGRYRETALALLMMRVQFNKKVMLDNSLLAQELKSVGALEKAYEYLVDIEKVFALPFASEIGYDMYGFLPPMKSEVVFLTPDVMKSIMVNTIQKIHLRGKKLKNIKQSQWTGDEAKDKAQLQKSQARADQIFADLDAKLQLWK